MPLVFAQMHTTLRVLRVSGTEELRTRLATLGITMGSELRIVAGTAGNFILDVRGSRLALDHKVCRHIEVACVG